VTLRMTGDLSQAAPSYYISWDVTGLPMQPLVNTLTPQFKGMVSGNLSSRSQIKGVGITGVNLQKSLVGDVSVVLTNANIQALSGSAKLWIIPVNLNLIASLLRMPELARSPISLVDVRATMGEGLIRLNQALVQGDAVAARGAGVLRIADRLDDSAVDVPLDIALARTLAQRANLVSAETPPEAAYVSLPPIAALGGNLSRVETKTDKAQIAGLVLRATTGVVGGTAVDAVQGVTKAVGGVGAALAGLFGGKRNESSTNAASTNKPSGGNPLNLFKKKQ
ncbi:MAG: hypothetical protein FJ405_15885, partial [Verrucomicrobia bacterium]|nr:hypothetical protein [Verrucomicrobiota bacterium]